MCNDNNKSHAYKTERERENKLWFLNYFCYFKVLAIAYSDSFIHSSMALQPFVGPWPLLQLHNLFYTDVRTPWMSDQPIARPLPACRTTQTQ
jgi:hypothetical protein